MKLFIDSDAVVLNLHKNETSLMPCCHSHILLGCGIFYCVIEDIDERFGYAFPVGVDSRQVFSKLHRS